MNTASIKQCDILYNKVLVNPSVVEVNKYKNNWVYLDEVRNFLKSEKGYLLNEELEDGGFGAIYSIEGYNYTSQVLKVTSFKQYLKKHHRWEENKNEKFIPKELCENFLQKFSNEGHIHVNLNGNKHFPKTYDVFSIVLVQAKDIIDVLLCIRMKQYDNVPYRRLKEHDMLKVVKDVLLCLGGAHKRGFVHRDISNENIMYDSDSCAYILIDWGTTKIFNQMTTTSAGYKDKYIAPERLDETAGGAAERDPRADIYSVGVVLYYWANNCSLKDKSTKERTLSPDYGRLRHVSDAYFRIMKKALNNDPGKRYQRVEIMLQDVENALAEIEQNANKASKKEPPLQKKKISDNLSNDKVKDRSFFVLPIIGTMMILLSIFVWSYSDWYPQIWYVGAGFGGYVLCVGVYDRIRFVTKHKIGCFVLAAIIPFLSTVVYATSIERATSINDAYYDLLINNQQTDKKIRIYVDENGMYCFNSIALQDIGNYEILSRTTLNNNYLVRTDMEGVNKGRGPIGAIYGFKTYRETINIELKNLDNEKTEAVRGYYFADDLIYISFPDFLQEFAMESDNSTVGKINIFTEKREQKGVENNISADSGANELDKQQTFADSKEQTIDQTKSVDSQNSNANKSSQKTSVKSEETSSQNGSIKENSRSQNPPRNSNAVSVEESSSQKNETSEFKDESTLCPVCGSKYHSVHPNAEAPTIDKEFD